MKLVPAQLVAAAAADHAHGDEHGHDHDHAGGDHSHDAGGIEWEDDMLEVNRITTPANMRWKLVDRDTGAEGHAIDWRFRVGDQVKIRIVNEMDSDHPMHHPFHIHGAGRFLILARDGITEPNLVWKDTVLVPTGQTVDILLDVTHAGVWMAHCHIAEHHESGMMLTFTVDEPRPKSSTNHAARYAATTLSNRECRTRTCQPATPQNRERASFPIGRRSCERDVYPETLPEGAGNEPHTSAESDGAHSGHSASAEATDGDGVAEAGQRMRAIVQKEYGTADVLRCGRDRAAGDRSRRGAGAGSCRRP